MPRYPGMLPHHRPPLELTLEPASAGLIKDVFMRIEQPEVHGAPAEPDVFETLGQFYHALEIALTTLSGSHDLFANPQLACQLSDPSYYAPVAYDAEDSGGLVLVNDLESALTAIEIIVYQGEGLSTERWADPAHQELTHYSKLLQISDGTSPLGSVRAVGPGPVTREFPAELQPVSNLFNAGYRYLFYILSDLFTAHPDKSSAVGNMYQLMAGVMSELALFLVRQPLDNGTFAGPTFEIFAFASDDREAELAALAGEVAETYPELAGVNDAIGALRPK